jgi:hypothetical protein
MSKKVTHSDPASLQDAAYRFALTGETTRSLAQYVMTTCPTFLDDVPKDVKAQLFAGFQTRKHEITPVVHYKLADGGRVFVEVPAGTEGATVISINVAMSYTGQEFGAMRERDPAMHAVIKPMRDKFSTYASSNMKTLTGAIRALVNEGRTRERAANKAFREAVNQALDALDKRVRTAKDRGDTEADPVRFRLARDAFWRTYDAS